jgi:hypothetical protein
MLYYRLSTERMEGCMAAVRELGLILNRDFIVPWCYMEDPSNPQPFCGFVEMKSRLALPEPPDSVFKRRKIK